MLTRDDKAGLYLTVIFHLVILIVLLIAQIGFSLQKENSFVIDFTKQEEIEAREKKQRFDEEVEKKVDDLIAAKVDRLADFMAGLDIARHNSVKEAVEHAISDASGVKDALVYIGGSNYLVSECILEFERHKN